MNTTTTSSESPETQKSADFEVIIGDDRRYTIRLVYKTVAGQKLEGKFIFKIPTVGDILKIGIEEANMLSAAKDPRVVSARMQDVAYIVATLKVCLVNWPDWFSVEDITDMELELLSAIYVRHAAIIDRYRERSSIIIDP